MSVSVERAYHRHLSIHNRHEFDLVRNSREVWGREARVLAGGICVQAYPDRHTGGDAYAFGCVVPPLEKFGFRGKVKVVREVVWALGMPGVEEREGGKFAAIPILWCER